MNSKLDMAMVLISWHFNAESPKFKEGCFRNTVLLAQKLACQPWFQVATGNWGCAECLYSNSRGCVGHTSSGMPANEAPYREIKASLQMRCGHLRVEILSASEQTFHPVAQHFLLPVWAIVALLWNTEGFVHLTRIVWRINRGAALQAAPFRSINSVLCRRIPSYNWDRHFNVWRTCFEEGFAPHHACLQSGMDETWKSKSKGFRETKTEIAEIVWCLGMVHDGIHDGTWCSPNCGLLGQIVCQPRSCWLVTGEIGLNLPLVFPPFIL